MKSWRTTSLGIACLALCAWLCWQNYDINVYHLCLRDMLHYHVQPFLALAAGVGLIHARDHKQKD